MASIFIVEDGTGVTSANSYMTVVEFKAYHADRGNDVTGIAGGGGGIEKLLVQATDYIEQAFVKRFKGSKEFNNDQPLSFPRLSLYNRNGDLILGIPDKLKWAQAEYALYANTNDLFSTPTVDATGMQVTKDLKKVGPITTEKNYAYGSQPDTVREWPKADRWLDEYLTPGGGVIRA